MNGRQVIRTPLSSALTQLYGYIYCMLVSNIVVGMPLFGGALYLCGRAGVVFFSVYSKKNRKYLPAHSRRWGIALGVLLGMIAVLLMGLYPAGFQSPQIWIMFAAVLLCLIADGLEGRIRRLRENDGPASRHAWGATFALQALLIGAMALIMFTAIGGRTAAAMTIGFAVLLLVFLVLNATNYITLFNNVPSLILIGAMAIGCCLVGINAIKRSRRAEIASVEEEKLTASLDKWLDENITDDLFAELEGEELSEELLYLRRTEIIRAKLFEAYPDLDESYADDLIEDYYNTHFDDSVNGDEESEGTDGDAPEDSNEAEDEEKD